MPKEILFDDLAWQKIRSGVASIANAMKVTLGPSGKNVIIEKSFGNPESVNDGKSIAKEVELPDPFENMGAKMIAEAAEKTSDKVGDGTTTTAILAQSIYEQGLKYITVNVNAIHIKKGIDKAVNVVVDKLKEMSIPVKGKEDYRKIATVAANYDKNLGNMIADAMEKVGKEGVITVEEGKSGETVLEFGEGMDFDKGYISPYFINKPNDLSVELNDPYILIYEKKITSVQELVPLLELVVTTGKPLFIIAEEVEGEALALLVVNRLQGSFSCCAVKAPAFGDRKKAMLEDIAILTGGTLISEESGRKLENVTIQELGRAKQIRVEKEKTTIIEGAGNKKDINERIEQIRKLAKETTSEYDREKFDERLAKIQGGVALIKVGAPTEAAMKDRKIMVDNAVHAAQAAREEGILPGGGLSYMRAVPELVKLEKSLTEEAEKMGVRILIKALEAPLKQIAINAGYDAPAVVEDVKENTGMTGFDAISGKLVNMVETGIIDPAKVVRLALQNSSSIVGAMLISRTLITDVKDKRKKVEGSVR
jgi:chaperonin GroEL